MAQQYRNQSGRSDESREGRYQGGSDRDRYRTGGEQQSGDDWYNRSRGVTEHRSPSGGSGYSDEFGYSRGRNRDESSRGAGSHDYQTRGSSRPYYQSGRSPGGDYDREGQSRFEESRFEEGNRWESSGDDDYGSEEFLSRNRGTSTSRWHEDENEGGRYFNTGSYADEGDASRGIQRDFYRARAQQERDIGSYRDRSPGDYPSYGRSYYGSQSNYRRGQGDESRQWRSQQGGENRDWDYGHQSSGSNRWGGGFGRDPQFSSRNYGYWQGSGQNYGEGNRPFGASQSFRGRGPQGYQRSDERLKEMICERLTDDDNIDASNVTIEVNSQIVKLTGTVDDRRAKYEIEEFVERLGGVKDIDNQLRVQSSRHELQQGSQQSSGTASAASQQGTGQQQRGGSGFEAGSSSTTATTGRTTSSSGPSTTGSPSAGSTTKRS